MEMEIRLEGSDRVEARFNGLSLATHQDGSAPSPFELFLASMGTCAGIYISRFCRQRGIPPESIRLLQRIEPDPSTGLVGRVALDLHLPADFPERYREPLVRTALLCSVKKHLDRPPEVEVRTVQAR
jgi:putative redox protein